MKQLSLFLALAFILGCGQQSTNVLQDLQSENGIIGGTITDPNSSIARSTVYVQTDWYLNGQRVTAAGCTGVIISPNSILTAGHCVFRMDGLKFDTAETKVVFGADLADKSSQVAVWASSIVKHPKYDVSSEVNDIAVITLNQPVPVPFKPALILKDFYPALTIGTKVTVAGYGVVSEIPLKTSKLLKQTDLKIIDIPMYSVNLSATNENTVCHGDSGGPAFVSINGEFYLWGTSSRGDGEGKRECGEYSTYTRLDYSSNQAFLKPYANAPVNPAEVSPVIPPAPVRVPDENVDPLVASRQRLRTLVYDGLRVAMEKYFADRPEINAEVMRAFIMFEDGWVKYAENICQRGGKNLRKCEQFQLDMMSHVIEKIISGKEDMDFYPKTESFVSFSETACRDVHAMSALLNCIQRQCEKKAAGISKMHPKAMAAGLPAIREFAHAVSYLMADGGSARSSASLDAYEVMLQFLYEQAYTPWKI